MNREMPAGIKKFNSISDRIVLCSRLSPFALILAALSAQTTTYANGELNICRRFS